MIFLRRGRVESNLGVVNENAQPSLEMVETLATAAQNRLAGPGSAASRPPPRPRAASSRATPSSASRRSRSASKAGAADAAGPWQVELQVQRDPPGAQHEHTVGQQHRLLDVVGDEEDAGPVTGAQVRHEVLHAQASQGVERGEGLVEEEELGFAHEGAGQGDPLGLAARERSRPGVGLASRPTSRRAVDRGAARVPSCGAAR